MLGTNHGNGMGIQQLMKKGIFSLLAKGIAVWEMFVNIPGS